MSTSVIQASPVAEIALKMTDDQVAAALKNMPRIGLCSKNVITELLPGWDEMWAARKTLAVRIDDGSGPKTYHLGLTFLFHTDVFNHYEEELRIIESTWTEAERANESHEWAEVFSIVFSRILNDWRTMAWVVDVEKRFYFLIFKHPSLIDAFEAYRASTRLPEFGDIYDSEKMQPAIEELTPTLDAFIKQDELAMTELAQFMVEQVGVPRELCRSWRFETRNEKPTPFKAHAVYMFDLGSIAILLECTVVTLFIGAYIRHIKRFAEINFDNKETTWRQLAIHFMWSNALGMHDCFADGTVIPSAAEAEAMKLKAEEKKKKAEEAKAKAKVSEIAEITDGVSKIGSG